MSELKRLTSDDLAKKRTVLAAERTLMAWTRTALSMIGFGFTIYKFLQYMRMEQGVKPLLRPQGPRNLGLALIALGVFALLVACLQHWAFLRKLGAEFRERGWWMPLLVAGSIGILGALALVSILFRMGPF
jgi:putative membrane protein